jgi:iron complex outermembrane recepter protein
MTHRMNFTNAVPACAVVALLWASWLSVAKAQGVATEAEWAPVVIRGTAVRSGLATNLPSNTASKTAEQLRQQNLVNPEDALNYVPNTTIRKRYIGDRNALIGGRSFGTLQPSRALVYVDGYLISNFLGRFDAPRWNMVTPESIARVDVLYGPFSAIYPGNSIGTTVAITEREPKGFEASARLMGYAQQFDQYGQSDRFSGNQASAYLGHRLASGLWYSAHLNHQNSTSQPMNYAGVSANAAGVFPAVAGAATPVTGIQYDTDPKGLKRAIWGASGGAIDHTVQDTFKVKAGYNFTRDIQASAMLGLWTNRTDNTNRSFLRDAAGNTVWSGVVSHGANTFNVPNSAFAPSNREELHRQFGATLKTRYSTGWNGSVVYSNYRIVKDLARQANVAENLAASGGSGSVTRRDGTGWNTLELQGRYVPADADFMGGRHGITFGLHRNAYVLDSPTTSAADWRAGDQGLLQRYAGRTEVTALYAQDAWRLNDDYTLTWGWREERFKASAGSQQTNNLASCNATNSFVTCQPAGAQFNKLAAYPERNLRGSSPKISLAWGQPEALRLKASVGRGVRFPNVEELYNGTVTASSESFSDPNLQPERSNALELSVEKDWGAQQLRISIFHDDVRDAVLRQSDTTTVPGTTRTYISNVDRVKTSGIELVWKTQDWGVQGLSIDANLALTRAKVVANAKDPASVGQYALRVPKVRANVLVSYRPNPQWMASAGVRHSGRAYNDVYNQDTHPDVYGGVSSFTFLDLRTSYKLHPQLELALGIDNLANARGYQFHPYPGRTFFTELRATY